MKQMMDQTVVRTTLIFLIATFLASQLMTSVTARYLPTRSQDDRLDKLRELLKDLLESGYERRAMIEYGDVAPGPGIYKRSVNAPSQNRAALEPALEAIDRSDTDRLPSSLVQQAQNIRRSMK